MHLQAQTALIECDEQGRVQRETTREEITQKAHDLGVQTNKVAALVANANLTSSLEVLAMWSAGQCFFPLHPRWDMGLRNRVLSRFQIVSESGTTLWLALPRPEDRCAIWMPTSGSSGELKVARLGRPSLHAALSAHAERMGWRDGDRWLLSLPIAHIGGLSILLRCFEAGATVVIPATSFSALAWFEVICRAQVTLLSLVPTQLSALVSEGLKSPGHVRAVLLGGAPCSRQLYEKARNLGWPILRTYGCTEACSQLATEVTFDGGLRPLRGVSFEVNDQGLLLVRGPQLYDGYVGERSRLPSEPLHTCDLGLIEPNGNIRILGRADETIITGGENVSPRLVEERLREFSGVDNACVVGIADETWGQVVGALLVVNPAFDEARFLAAQATWPAHLRVRRFHLVSDLPQNANGKLDRIEAHRQLAASATNRNLRST